MARIDASEITAYTYADGLLGHEANGTSVGAAVLAGYRADADAQRVYALIADAGKRGVVDDEGEELLDLAHQTYSARRRGLAIQGHVIDSGRTRPTRSGKPATIWIRNTKKNRKKAKPLIEARERARAERLAARLAKSR